VAKVAPIYPQHTMWLSGFGIVAELKDLNSKLRWILIEVTITEPIWRKLAILLKPH